MVEKDIKYNVFMYVQFMQITLEKYNEASRSSNL